MATITAAYEASIERECERVLRGEYDRLVRLGHDDSTAIRKAVHAASEIRQRRRAEAEAARRPLDDPAHRHHDADPDKMEDEKFFAEELARQMTAGCGREVAELLAHSALLARRAHRRTRSDRPRESPPGPPTIPSDAAVKSDVIRLAMSGVDPHTARLQATTTLLSRLQEQPETTRLSRTGRPARGEVDRGAYSLADPRAWRRPRDVKEMGREDRLAKLRQEAFNRALDAGCDRFAAGAYADQEVARLQTQPADALRLDRSSHLDTITRLSACDRGR